MRTTALPRWTRCLAMLLVAFLSGCASTHIGLPVHEAWFEGERVHYITTDISDAAMAQALGVNHVPRLADALPAEPAQPGQRSLVERVYKFASDEQASVFPSVPKPVGPGNLDRSYSPLWVMVMVHWQPGRTPRLLNAEEAILAAEERGDVTLQRTRIVINCPVLRTARGGALRDLR